MKSNDLGARMKTYERVTRNFVTQGVPKVIRLDMRAGHTFCGGLKKPFDEVFSQSMIAATKELCKKIPGVRMAYTQSDEISLIINDVTERGQLDCFFNGNISKMISLSASICTLAFNKKFAELYDELPEDEKPRYSKGVWAGQFDSRVFCLPSVQEVQNYLIWRQQDATRNSIQMVGHANFSDKEMHKKNTDEIQDMLFKEKGINWNDFPVKYKRGTLIVKERYMKDTEVPNRGLVSAERSRWTEFEIPILTKDKTLVPALYEYGVLKDGKIVRLE